MVKKEKLSNDVTQLEFVPSPLAQLEELMVLCRRYGVLSIKNAAVAGMPCAVDIDFAAMLASDPNSVAPSSPQVTAAPASEPPKSDPKVGADGLHADMQEELLGRVMDAKR